MTTLTMPAGCVCDANTWDSEPPLPCDSFTAVRRTMHCERCEHDDACHVSSVDASLEVGE